MLFLQMCKEKDGRKLTETDEKNLTDIPVNPAASPEARELLGYLCSVAGKRIITGQHTQTRPMEEIAYIRDKTGKEPKLRGFELLSYSRNIPTDRKNATEACLTEIRENRGTAETALNWAEETVKQNSPDGKWHAASCGIVTMTWHWFSPLYGRDKSFYAANTSFEPERVLQEGTPERERFYGDMDVIASVLSQFQGAGIPILWRPFHESDGTWFWWGRRGPETAEKLYLLMYDYFTKVKHLDHLLWVWNCRLKAGYPGDDRVDVISVDLYPEENTPTDYREDYGDLVRETTAGKVAALAETGNIPDVRLLEKSRVPWAYYMCWSKEFCMGEEKNSTEKLREMYQSKYAVTL